MKLESLRKIELTRRTGWERQTADALADIIVVLLAIVAYSIRLVALLLYRFKKQLYRASIVLLVFTLPFALGAMNKVAYSPYADASEFPVVENPVSEQDLIVNYIHEVFGKDADRALMIAKCESGLNPDATGYNTNGTVDAGLFQINSVHGVRAKWLYNYKTNTEIAYQIFTEQGGFQAWVCARKLGL